MDTLNKLYLHAFEAGLTFFTGCVISSDLDMCVGIYFLLMIGLLVQIKLLFSYISGSQCITSPHNRLFASIILVITLNPRYTK